MACMNAIILKIMYPHGGILYNSPNTCSHLDGDIWKRCRSHPYMSGGQYWSGKNRAKYGRQDADRGVGQKLRLMAKWPLNCHFMAINGHCWPLDCRG